MFTTRKYLATGIHLCTMRSEEQHQDWLGQPFLAPGHLGSPQLDKSHKEARTPLTVVSSMDICLRAPIFMSMGPTFLKCVCTHAHISSNVKLPEKLLSPFLAETTIVMQAGGSGGPGSIAAITHLLC